MMSIKVVFVALAVVCAAQAYAIDNEATFETYDASNIFDKIEAMLEKARQRIKDLDKELKDAIDQGYEKVQAAAEKVAEQWYQVINRAVEEANKHGVDVTECISENHALTAIADQITKDSRQCISNEKPVVEQVQQKLEALLEQQEDLLESAKQAVKECEGKPLVEAIGCNVQHLVPLVGEAAQVLASAGVVAGEVTVITVKSANNVRVCVKGVFGTQGQAAKQIVDKATQCIREKIQGNGNQQFALY